METAVNDVVKIDYPVQEVKPKLTVHTIAAMLQKNMNQSQIAESFGISRQAVSAYMKRNENIIYEIIQPDAYMALKFKAEAINALDSVTVKDREKASYLQKVTASGILTDKYRLLSGQSTDNIAIDASLRAIHSKLFALPDAPVNITPDNTKKRRGKPKK